MIRHPSALPVTAALLIAGFLAGTQLGKLAPLVGWYRQELGFSLVFIGWLTAAIGFFVALAALPAGFAIGRFGNGRSFVWSSFVLVIGGAALAVLQHPAAIMLARLVEGLGYLVLVIAIPALLNEIAPPRSRAAALAVWGGFVPIGFAIADFLAASMLPVPGPVAFLGTAVALYAVSALVAGLLIPAAARTEPERPPQEGSSFAANFTMPVILTALAFGLYVVLSIGFFAFMPAAVERPGAAFALSAGLIALVVPLGNVLAAALMSGRGAHLAAWLALGGFALTAATAVPAFSSQDGVLATVCVAVLAAAGGITASALFASIPSIVPPRGSAAVVIGLICQSGGIATVAGPPWAAHVIERYGWTGFGWLLAVLSLLGIASLVPLVLRRQSRLAI